MFHTWSRKKEVTIHLILKWLIMLVELEVIVSQYVLYLMVQKFTVYLNVVNNFSAKTTLIKRK